MPTSPRPPKWKSQLNSRVKAIYSKILALLTAIIAAVALPGVASAQLLSTSVQSPEQMHELADSVKRDFLGPYFGLYKDNYFTVGTTIGHKPTRQNSDVKFQISLSIRLTNNTLPWGTYLYLFYTQKTFWNVFEESLPMHDLNFNPGIGWTKPFFVKGRYVGKMSLIVEHESNGKDSIWSRSWNRISLSGSVAITRNLMVHAKYWIPIIDSGNNADILRYAGIFQWGCALQSHNRKFSGNATFTKRAGWNFKWNVCLDFAWRVNEKTNLNLFAQYYYGYGENLIDYNKLHSRLRVGICFKPKFFSDY